MVRGERLGRPGWSWFLLLAASIGLLAGGARWYYLREVATIENFVFNQMAEQSDFVSRQLESWREERVQDGRVFASEAVVDLVDKFLHSNDGGSRTKLQNLLETVRSSGNYAGIALVDPAGRLRLSTGDVPASASRFASLRAAAGGKPTFSDIYLEPVNNKPWVSVVVPLRQGYAFFLDVDPQSFLYPYLLSRLQNTRTGETYLVSPSKQFSRLSYLSPRRGKPGTELRDHRALNRSAFPTDPAAYRNGFAIRTHDYRNQIALFNLRLVGDTNWYVVSKIDEAEVTEQLTAIRWQIFGVLLLACGVNLGIAFIAWKNHQLRFYRNRRDWFRRIASDTPAFLWTIEADGGVSFLNTQMRRFLGQSGAGNDSARADSDRFADLTSFVHPDEAREVRLRILDALRLETEYIDEFHLRRFDGQYRLMVIHALPRYDPDDTFTGLAGCCVDVTEQRAAEDRVREANSRIVRELVERTRSENEVSALSSRLIVAHEEERTRLARELHDGLCQQLAAVSIAASNLKRKIPPDAPQALEMTESIRHRLVNLADTIRHLSHELHPASLELAGLAAALQSYCAELTALTSHEVDLYIEGSYDGVPLPIALCVYRVAQESLSNSARHSGAQVTQVRLSHHNDEIHLIVADHGNGIAATATAGLGLVSMRERTRLAGGVLDVDSQPRKGVTIRLTVPIHRPGSHSGDPQRPHGRPESMASD